jgi:hypothetical protein
MKIDVCGTALGLLLLSCTSAHALGPTIGGPTTGFWYNAQESGRGFDIDLQGDTMVVTTFAYTPSGDPIWYLSSGTYNYATGVFQSSYDSYSDGQCLGCPPQRPDLHSGAGGPITVTFHNNVTATLTYPGGSTNITKYNYGAGAGTDNLYGEWAFTYDIGGLVGGDWIIFNAPFTGSNGITYASGSMDLASQYVALGYFDTSANSFFVLVSIGNFEDFLRLGLDDHRGIGAAWVLASGEDPTGDGSPAAASRLLFRSEITAAAANPQKSARDLDRAKFAQQGAGIINQEAAAVLNTLRQASAEKRAAL